MSSSASDGLVKKWNTSSAVWTYFGFEPDQEGQPKDDSKPVCKICLDKGTTRVVSTKGANTSNLLSHLKTTHPSVYVPSETCGVYERAFHFISR